MDVKEILLTIWFSKIQGIIVWNQLISAVGYYLSWTVLLCTPLSKCDSKGHTFIRISWGIERITDFILGGLGIGLGLQIRCCFLSLNRGFLKNIGVWMRYRDILHWRLIEVYMGLFGFGNKFTEITERWYANWRAHITRNCLNKWLKERSSSIELLDR
jgi:hypothetical protein